MAGSSYRPHADFWILARPKCKRYGSFPAGFLSRARELLGCAPQDPVLHVCSGAVRGYPYRGFGPNDLTLDLDPECEPDFCQDAREPFPLHPCEEHVVDPHADIVEDWVPSTEPWKGVLMDPPYSEEDAGKYPCGAKALPTPARLLRNALDAVGVGRKIGILHYVSPTPPKDRARLTAWVAVMVGFRNRIRLYSVYERIT